MIEMNFKEIGNRIRERRKSLGMTQKRLAEMVNLSEGSVSRYEHGKVEEATTSKLNDFARVLNVDTSWLLGLKEERTIDSRLKMLSRLADGVPDDIMNRYIDIIEELIQIYKEVDDDDTI